MAQQLFTNNASGTLASTFSNTDTILTLTTGQGALFPLPTAGDYFIATVENNAGVNEIIKVTTRAGDAFTVLARAQEGTVAATFAAGSRVELRPTAGMMQNLMQKADGVLYYNAVSKKIVATLDGMQLWGRPISSGSESTLIDALSSDGITRYGYIQFNKTSGQVIFESDLIGAPFLLQGKDNGGTVRAVFSADPDGGGILYWQGGSRFQVTSTGASLVGNLAITGSGIDVGSGLTITCGGETLAQFAANGADTLYYDNVIKFNTHTNGLVMRSSNAIATPPVANPGNGVFYWVDADGSDQIAELGFLNSTSLVLINQIRSGNVTLWGTTAAGGNAALFNASPDGQAILYYGGSPMLATSAGGVQVTGTLDASTALTVGNVPVSLSTHTHAGLATKFESAPQAMSTNGSVAHALGRVPDIFHIVLRCIADDAGTQYIAGDEVFIASSYGTSTVESAGWANATYLGWALNVTNPAINLKNTSSQQNINPAKWNIVCRGVIFS
jgi:hypothetical protein